MSKRNKNRDEDEDFSVSSSSASYNGGARPKSKSLKKSTEKVDKEIENLAFDFVYHLQIANQKKLPIKKADIVHQVFKGKSHYFAPVKKKAEEMLKEVFGFELTEVPDKKGQYILRNTETAIDPLELSESEERHKRGLLFFVLSVIYMNDGAVSEEELAKALQKIDIDITSNKAHSLLGGVKKYLTQDLVKMLYLKYEVIPDSDPASYVFRWGYRAECEVDKLEMLKSVCQVYENQPEDWVSQFQNISRVMSNDNDGNG